ncbi:MAG: cobalamin biosynthesis protein CbiM [Chloroflexi bacterium]|nr:cobalamin biosynthesis protein CbiM [Chloroflexi bacterium CFX1]MCK6567549.1 energy-coupling factor ABC transporter permease [Anaerolineales bacterium]MCQ3952727.1 cobalamin biosynthesis protein CbiM [Chloroflexota bacterium]MDL1919231.1 cobalamin biosynthesis protein CbiM [Chloroflexi bacterium CFX5]NUQ60130.1 PDGLE domain-containing protein [Anaerolineales bacterium]
MLYSPAPLHIPDGFLSLMVSIVCWVAAALTLAAAISRTNRSLGERQIPLMGVMAAFIFAAQMINFPVAGGTSGHLLGGALAAIVLGPWAGMLVMTAVIAVQALLFQDGGLLVMGANILNMGLVTAAIGYGLYRLADGRSKTVKLGITGVAAWLSVMAGALLTSLQLWLSGTSPLQVVVPAMLGVHALIGVGEALITVSALGFILQTRPDLLGAESESSKAGKGWILAGGVISLFVVFLSPFASSHPDGLERVAEDLGFLQAGQAAPYNIVPDYTLPFLGQTALSTILAGALGAITVGLVVLLISRGIKAKT